MSNTYRFFHTYRFILCTVFCACISINNIDAQLKSDLSFFTPADTLNKKRLYYSSTFSAVTYSGFSYGLYNAWYKQYDQESFHLFNDLGEWRHMDKIGHFYTAYFQGVLCYKGAKWTGLSKSSSITTGIVLGSLFQTTIEVMDGFSAKWGFSIPDMSMNILGSSAFALQQHYWDDQRITFKVSNVTPPYPDITITSTDGTTSTTIINRAENLYGSSFAERFLKDYNTQVIWASVNIHSFLPAESSFPHWLNIAVGYGAGNMFGGYENKWVIDDKTYLANTILPRYSSFYLAPDIDLWKLRTPYKSLNSVLDMLNIFKIPMPAIEYNTLGEFHFHLFI